MLAQPNTELREPSHNSEDQVSGSDTILGTHRFAKGRGTPHIPNALDLSVRRSPVSCRAPVPRLASAMLRTWPAQAYARPPERMPRICDVAGERTTLRLELLEAIGRVAGFDAKAVSR